MPSENRVLFRSLAALGVVALAAAAGHAQTIALPGDLLISTVDADTGQPQVFVASPTGLLGGGLFTVSPSEPPLLSSGSGVSFDGLLSLSTLSPTSGRYSLLGYDESGPGIVHKKDILKESEQQLGVDTFDLPLAGFEDPLLGFEDPLLGFSGGSLALGSPFFALDPDFLASPSFGFEDPLLGFEDPLLGFEDPLLGFEDPLLGYTAESITISDSASAAEATFAIPGLALEHAALYPAGWFIDPDEIGAFGGGPARADRMNAGVVVVGTETRFGFENRGVYLLPFTRQAIENRTLTPRRLFVGQGVFDPENEYTNKGIVLDPSSPGTVAIWGTNGTARGLPITHALDPGDITTILKNELDNLNSISWIEAAVEDAYSDLVFSREGDLYGLLASGDGVNLIEVDSRGGVRESSLVSSVSAFDGGVSISVVTNDPTDIVINTTDDLADPNPGDGIVGDGVTRSLRAAIMEANASGGVWNIYLPDGDFRLEIEGQDFGSPGADVGDLDVETDIRIKGSGSGYFSRTQINAEGRGRVFDVHSGSLVLEDLVLTRADQLSDNGGAIRSRTALQATNVRFVNNQGQSGAAVAVDAGTASFTRCHFEGNTTRSGNGVGGSGGAIASTGDIVRVDTCSFFFNQARNGSAITINRGTFDMLNCTVAANESQEGRGAVTISSSVDSTTILHSTFYGNWITLPFESSYGAGLHVVSPIASPPVVGGSVFAFNSGTLFNADITGPIESLGHNLIRDTEGALLSGNLGADLYGLDPMLEPLPREAGILMGFWPAAGSPLIDGGAIEGTPDFDIFGTARSIDGIGDGFEIADIGAAERIARTCPGDLTTTGATLPEADGFGISDGAVDLDDLGYFLNAWVATEPAGDVTRSGASIPGTPDAGIPDGVIDLDDLGYFLNAWVSGCV